MDEAIHTQGHAMKQISWLILILFALTGPVWAGDAVRQELGFINEVLDGNNVILELNGQTYHARLLGVDAPRRRDCYGMEAAQYLKKLVKDEMVIVEFIGDKPNVNASGLIVVGLTKMDRDSVNLEMIRNGYAYANHSVPTWYGDDLRKDEKRAWSNRRGLWKYCRDENGSPYPRSQP